MPFKAYIDGTKIISPLIPQKKWLEWKEKKAEAILDCCGAPAVLVLNSHNTQYFRHKANKKAEDCPWHSESWQHLLAKEEILKACHALDIEADTEVIGEGWRADVLVDHDGKTMAFEVQLSIQSFAETIIRQKHFKESNVIGFWLFKNEQLPQKELRYVQEIPSFEIFYRKMDNQFRVFKNRGRSLLHISLKEFIQGILLREIRFSHFLDRVIDVTPRFTEVECLKCNNISHVLSYRAYDTSRCGYRSRYNENEEQTAYPNSPLKESIAEALLNYTIENAPSNIKPNLGICPFCETELYIWFSYSNGRIIRQFTDDNFKFRFKYIDRTGHWCIPLETGNFCDAHLPI